MAKALADNKVINATEIAAVQKHVAFMQSNWTASLLETMGKKYVSIYFLKNVLFVYCNINYVL